MFVPLHAAGIYGAGEAECCADYVVSSYTPTLSALLRGQKQNPRLYKYEAKLGFVAAMRAWDVSLPTLWNVEEEIDVVRAAAEKASLSVDNTISCVGNDAVVSRVSHVFQNINLVHIACHGIQNNVDALSSGFCLSDRNLTVSRLMELDLKNAFFAFLSACETAKGDEKQPDQTIHLAAAMLSVGFRSVVATMW
jgi:CHAT domain-containing protein